MKKKGFRTLKIQRVIATYVIENWLGKVAFQDTVINGLLKTCWIKQNAAANIQLMSVALNKLFLQEEAPFTDECLQPLNRLF